MASFPKNPKSSGTKQKPANDPMLDALRASQHDDEPHFGASPAAVQAANAVLMANMRTKLGPAFAAPAGTPRMAAPTIEFPTKPQLEARPEERTPMVPAVENSALQDESAAVEKETLVPEAQIAETTEIPAEDVSVSEPISAAEIAPIEDNALSSFETADETQPVEAEELTAPVAPEITVTEPSDTATATKFVDMATPELTPAESAAPAPKVEGVTEIVVADISPAAETTFTEMAETPASLLAESEPAHVPDTSGQSQVFEAAENENEFGWKPERVSPAAARQNVDVPFDTVATTSERASRAFPALGEHEFRSEPETEATPQPSEDMFKEWQTTQSPSQRRLWRWALGALLIAGLGINYFLLKEAGEDKQKVSAARAPVSVSVPPAPVAPTPMPVAKEPVAAPMAPASVAPAPIAMEPPAMEPPAMIPAEPAPSLPRPALDPQKLLRLLSRP